MESKPGYKTTEFWVTLVVSGTAWIAHAAASGALPLRATAAIQTVLAVVYALSRGLAKQGVPYTGE
jgi:hypothetical protein